MAFFLLYFCSIDVFYYLTLKQLLIFWERAKEGGRKSFQFHELDKKYQISPYSGVMVHYLETLQMDLMEREI